MKREKIHKLPDIHSNIQIRTEGILPQMQV